MIVFKSTTMWKLLSKFFGEKEPLNVASTQRKAVMKRQFTKQTQLSSTMKKVKKVRKVKNSVLQSTMKTTTTRFAYTLTFAEGCENGVGMQQIGTKSDCGLSIQDLLTAKQYFDNLDCHCELIDLQKQGLNNDIDTNAYVLIVRQGKK